MIRSKKTQSVCFFHGNRTAKINARSMQLSSGHADAGRKSVALSRRTGLAEKYMALGGAFATVVYMTNAIFYEGLNEVLHYLMYVSAFCMVCCYVALCWRNASFAVVSKLLKEVNVVVLICVGLANWSIDTMYPFNAASPIMGFVYFLCLMVMLSIDVVEKKSRRFMVITFTFFLAITGHNVYSNMSANPPIVLADFNEYLQAQTTENRTGANFSVPMANAINGQVCDGRKIYKHNTKRGLFTQVFALLIAGLITVAKDSNQAFFVFITAPAYKKIDQLKWHNREVKLDEIKERVKNAEFFTAVIGTIVICSFIANDGPRRSTLLSVLYCTFGLIVVPVGFWFIGAKNANTRIATRVLIKEPNVIIVLLSALFNCALSWHNPRDFLVVVDAILYLFLLAFYFLLDTVIVKHRYFSVYYGATVMALTAYLLIRNSFGSTNGCAVYTKLFGKTVWKQSIKIALYIQIFIFLLQGTLTIFKDNEMTHYAFVTERAYRETGTSAEDQFSIKYQKRRRMEQKTRSTMNLSNGQNEEGPEKRWVDNPLYGMELTSS